MFAKKDKGGATWIWSSLWNVWGRQRRDQLYFGFHKNWLHWQLCNACILKTIQTQTQGKANWQNIYFMFVFSFFFFWATVVSVKPKKVYQPLHFSIDGVQGCKLISLPDVFLLIGLPYVVHKLKAVEYCWSSCEKQANMIFHIKSVQYSLYQCKYDFPHHVCQILALPVQISPQEAPRRVGN